MNTLFKDLFSEVKFVSFVKGIKAFKGMDNFSDEDEIIPRGKYNWFTLMGKVMECIKCSSITLMYVKNGKIFELSNPDLMELMINTSKFLTGKLYVIDSGYFDGPFFFITNDESKLGDAMTYIVNMLEDMEHTEEYFDQKTYDEYYDGLDKSFIKMYRKKVIETLDKNTEDTYNTLQDKLDELKHTLTDDEKKIAKKLSEKIHEDYHNIFFDYFTITVRGYFNFVE